MRKNTAGQHVGSQMISATTGADFVTPVTMFVSGNGGAQAPGGGAVTHLGAGYHDYAPTLGETNYEHIAFQFRAAGAITSTVQLYTDPTLAEQALLTILQSSPVVAKIPIDQMQNVIIVRGDSYHTVDGRSLNWTFAAWTGPVPGLMTATFVVKEGPVGVLTLPATLAMVGLDLVATIELTKEQTSKLFDSSYAYRLSLTITATGHVQTEVISELTVL